MTENLRSAKEGAEKNKACRSHVEKRNLTLRVVVNAVRAMVGGEAIDGKTLRMFEKDDHRLYGIAVRDLKYRDDGTTVDGTLVNLDGKTWMVTGVGRDPDGYKVFDLRAVDKSRPKQKGCVKHDVTIFQILEHAEKDQGVVEQEDERKRVNLVICIILVMAYVHVYRFIRKDPKTKKKRSDVELSEDDRAEVLGIRKFAWDKISCAKAVDAINAHELALLASDKDLQKKLGGENSLFGFLELDRFAAAGATGLMEKPLEFAEEYIPMVEHYIRGAQYAYRLGRVVCMQSCLAPLSAGGDYTELPPGVTLKQEEMATIPVICTREEAKEKGYGLATRALLARARDSEQICKWYEHVPLYRLMLFSRTGEDMMPTSENTSM